MAGMVKWLTSADCGSVIQGFDPLYSPHRGIASGKAPDFDSAMRWFESSYPCQV